MLVLPSRSEGLGRVVVEAFCRGRGVVGTRVGGIPDLVEDGETGLLVPPEDAAALADALVRVLSDRALAERLGAAARAARAALARDAGGVRPPDPRARRDRLRVGSDPWGLTRAAYTHAMRADRAKQLLKNGVYRAIGETVAAPARSTARPSARCAS